MTEHAGSAAKFEARGFGNDLHDVEVGQVPRCARSRRRPASARLLWIVALLAGIGALACAKAPSPEPPVASGHGLKAGEVPVLIELYAKTSAAGAMDEACHTEVCVAVNSTPRIFWYKANDPTLPGRPDRVRWILQVDDGTPSFDLVRIEAKPDQHGNEDLLRTVTISAATGEGTSTRATRDPGDSPQPWQYSVQVLDNGNEVGKKDPDVIIDK